MGRNRTRAGAGAVVTTPSLGANVSAFGATPAEQKVAQDAHMTLLQHASKLNPRTYYFENGILFDSGGNLREQINGRTNELPMTDAQWISIAGGAITHNHPIGSFLSNDDIAWVSVANNTDIQAVGKPILNGDATNRADEVVEWGLNYAADTIEQLIRTGKLNLNNTYLRPWERDAIRDTPAYIRMRLANGRKSMVSTVPKLTETQIQTILNRIPIQSSTSTFRTDRNAASVRNALGASGTVYSQKVFHDSGLSGELMAMFNDRNTSIGQAMASLSPQEHNRVMYAISTVIANGIVDSTMKHYTIPYAVSYEDF